MWQWFGQTDRVLRGEATRIEACNPGGLTFRPLLGAALILAAFHGACMGSFGVLFPGGSGWLQVLYSAIKLPMLFFFTLLVTFPSLYVFNALVGSRLGFRTMVQLLSAMLAVMLAVLASLGPIVVFFSISSTHYAFMLLLNVVVCAVAGFFGTAFLSRTLHRLVLVARTHEERQSRLTAEVATDSRVASTPLIEPVEANERQTALELVGSTTDELASRVFRVWLVVFGLVGAQMGWVLRPFLGSPGLPAEFLRPREGNFFETMWRTLVQLIGP